MTARAANKRKTVGQPWAAGSEFLRPTASRRVNRTEQPISVPDLKTIARCESRSLRRLASLW